MNKTEKLAIGAVLLIVAAALGLFTFITFTANNTPSMPHGYNLVYVTGTVTLAFLISGIWLMVSSFRHQK
jgi:hypothetical protein